jgi:putative FmdB family regulatory protein
MPIYEYRCTGCSEEFEVKSSFNEKSNVVCPVCDAQVSRVFSPALIVYKGSGFYTTDNRKNVSHSDEISDTAKIQAT